MTEQELYEYAVTLLSKRDYSSGDLKYQLSRLSDGHQVDAVMERLLSHHYVDDTRLIKARDSKAAHKAPWRNAY
jgi:regulatory protein